MGIEPKWTDLLVDWIDANPVPMPDGAEDSAYLGQNPPYLTANKYITSTTELLALPGFGYDRYVKLAPFVSALPPTTQLNVCSAAGVVLDAFTPGKQEYSLDPEGLAKTRANAGECFPKTEAYKTAFDPDAFGKVQGLFGMKSNYFRLTSLVTIGSTEFNLYSLLFQDSNGWLVHPILRTYSAD